MTRILGRLCALLAGPAALAALTVGFYWKITLTRQYTWLDSPDIAYHEAPRFEFQSRQFRAGSFPLWDPTEWCGQPLAGQMSGTLYPLNWPLYWRAGQSARTPQWLLQWYLVWMHLAAALSAYALARGLGRTRAAAVLCGLVYSLAAFLSTNDWPPLVNASVWAPLAFLLLIRSAEGRRPLANAAWGGVALGMAWLAGHHEPALYATMAAAAVWAWYILENGRPDLRVAGRGAVMGLCLAMVAALQVLPAAEFARTAVRWVSAPDVVRWKQAVPYLVHKQFSFTPRSFAGILLPGEFDSGNPYLGAAVVALVAVGLMAAWRERPVKLFAAIGLGSFALALGAWSLFHGLLYATLPMMDSARVPARAIVLLNLAAAPLAAYGFDSLSNRGEARRVGLVLTALGALSAVVLLYRAFAGQPPIEPRFQLSGLMALGCGALALLCAAGRVAPRAAGFVLAGVALVELSNVGPWGFTDLVQAGKNSLWVQLHSHDDVAQFLRRQPRPFRVEVDDQAFPANFGQWYGVDTLTGFSPVLTANIVDTLHYNERTRDLLAVTYYVGKGPVRPGQELVYTSPGGLKVYRNPNAFPRAWAVHRVTAIADRERLLARLDDPALDLREHAVVAGPAPALESCQGDSVEVVRHDPKIVQLNAKMNCRGMVILADTYFPGWQATVDGRPAAILETDGALRGIVAEAGAHTIELTYTPASVRNGAIAALAGLAGAGLITWWERRRQRSGLAEDEAQNAAIG